MSCSGGSSTSRRGQRAPALTLEVCCRIWSVGYMWVYLLSFPFFPFPPLGSRGPILSGDTFAKGGCGCVKNPARHSAPLGYGLRAAPGSFGLGDGGIAGIQDTPCTSFHPIYFTT